MCENLLLETLTYLSVFVRSGPIADSVNVSSPDPNKMKGSGYFECPFTSSDAVRC